MIIIKLKNIFPKITTSALINEKNKALKIGFIVLALMCFLIELIDEKKKAFKIGFTVLTLMYYLYIDKKAMAFSLYGHVVAMFIITIFFQALIHCCWNKLKGETKITETTAKFCSALALAIVFYYVHINSDTTLRNFIMIRNLALIIIGFLWTNNNIMMFRTNIEEVEDKHQKIQTLTNDVNDLQNQVNNQKWLIKTLNNQLYPTKNNLKKKQEFIQMIWDVAKNKKGFVFMESTDPNLEEYTQKQMISWGDDCFIYYKKDAHPYI